MVARTDYERALADPSRRKALRAEELILEATEAITQMMERGKVSRAELARRIGRSRGAVTQMLNGGRNLTLTTLAELADALDCRVQVRLQRAAPASRSAAAGRRRAG